MKRRIGNFTRDEHGQDLVECAMFLALVALITAVGVRTFWGSLNAWLGSLSSGPLS